MLRLIALALPAALACAQISRPTEAYGHAGWGSAWDDEGSIGSGISAGLNIGHRLTPKVAVEGDFNYFRHKREFSFATWKGTGAVLTGNLVYHFTSGRVQPYVLVGAGLMMYNPDLTLETDSSTGWAWGFGAGVKGFLTERVSIRPEWRVAVGHPERTNGP